MESHIITTIICAGHNHSSMCPSLPWGVVHIGLNLHRLESREVIHVESLHAYMIICIWRSCSHPFTSTTETSYTRFNISQGYTTLDLQ